MFRIMLRERGRGWEPYNVPIETREEARTLAKDTVRDSGFDGYQIWRLEDQQELQSGFVSTLKGGE